MIRRRAGRAKLVARVVPRARASSKARRAPGRDHGACRDGQAEGARAAPGPCGTPRTDRRCAGVSRCATARMDAHPETPAGIDCRRRGGEGPAGGLGPARQVHPASVAPGTLGAGTPTTGGTKRAGFPRCALRSPGGGRGSLRPRSRRLLGSGALGLAGPGFCSWRHPAGRTVGWAASSRASQSAKDGSEARAAAAIVFESLAARARGRRRRRRPGRAPASPPSQSRSARGPALPPPRADRLWALQASARSHGARTSRAGGGR